MYPNDETLCTAFAGSQCIASGNLKDVALAVKKVLDQDNLEPILIFDDATSQQIEVDFRGTSQDVVQRLAVASNNRKPEQPVREVSKGPGRPKLGVVSREVTLLPRHWEWLNSQPGGASVALRKLVEEARRTNQGKDAIRQAQEATYKFMSVMAGNEPGFEEAARHLFALNQQRFNELVGIWPTDIGNYAKKLAAPAFLE